MNFAGKTLAENLIRNLVSSLGAFSGSRWTRDLHCGSYGCFGRKKFPGRALEGGGEEWRKALFPLTGRGGWVSLVGSSLIKSQQKLLMSQKSSREEEGITGVVVSHLW